MARIEWVKQRLDNWALWKEREAGAGSGFYSESSFLKVGCSQGGYREAIIPVDEVDASVTNAAVESLRLTKSHLYMTLQLIYIRDTGIKGAAREMSRAESTIKANLDLADHAIAVWFANRREAQVQAPALIK